MVDWMLTIGLRHGTHLDIRQWVVEGMGCIFIECLPCMCSILFSSLYNSVRKSGHLDHKSCKGNGNPLQYSCLENPMDGGACWAAIHGVAKSWTWLSDFTFTFHFHLLSLFTFMPKRRKWQPTPVFLPGESQGQGSLVGCHLWGRTELDTTEAT